VEGVYFEGTDAKSAAVSSGAAGRGHPLIITDSILNDALRRVRPTATKTVAGEHGSGDAGLSSVPGDGQSATGGRRLKARPVTMAPSGGGGNAAAAVSSDPEWTSRVAKRRTQDD